MLKSGLAHTTTRAPSPGAGSAASSTERAQITRTETAATGSRRVRKAVLPRLVSSAIWPSTQTRPSRPTQSPTRRSTVRTGTGDSAVVCRGMATTRVPLRQRLRCYQRTGAWCVFVAGAGSFKRVGGGCVLAAGAIPGALFRVDLRQAPLKHGDHVVPLRVRLLVGEQGLERGGVEDAELGPQRGEREAVVTGQWRRLWRGLAADG